MAATFSRSALTVAGDKRLTWTNATLDNSYPSGGYAVTANNLSLGAIDSVMLPACLSGYVFEWDSANSKIKVNWGDNNNASDGVLIEITAGTDLHLIVVPILAVGV